MTKLTIVSDNPDFCGTWTKEDVVKDMKDLGVEAPEDQWLDWVFDHNFENETLIDTVNFLKCDYVKLVTITAMISGHSTTIRYSK